jgi:hypothetical protein
LRLDQRQELAWLFVGFGDTRAARFVEAIGGGTLFLQGPVGIDADHAEIKGQVAYFSESEARGQVADISLRLLRQTGEFVIDTFEVSTRRPLTPAQ